MEKVLECGIKKNIELNTAANNVNAVNCISALQHIVTTNKNILRFRANNLVAAIPTSTMGSIYIPEYDCLVYIDKDANAFKIHQIDTFKYCVYTSQRIKQMCVAHLLYSKKSKTLITIGMGIKTWYLRANVSPYRRAIQSITYTIEPRASFMDDYASTMLNIPSLDEENEILFVTGKNGVSIFDLNGSRIKSPISYNNQNISLFLFSPFNKKYITYDSTNGLLSFNKKGDLKRKFKFPLNQILTGFVVNKEFVLLVDATFHVLLINLKSQAKYDIMCLEDKPSKISFASQNGDMFLICCYFSTTTFYKLTIDWEIWRSANAPITGIMRCPLSGKGTRIMLEMASNSMEFYSPYSKKLLTSLQNKNRFKIKQYIVDRSSNPPRDNVIVLLEDGFVNVYDASVFPCSLLHEIDIRGVAAGYTHFYNEPYIVVGTSSGRAVFYSAINYNIIKKYMLPRVNFTKFYVDDNIGALLVVTKHGISCVNMNNGLEMWFFDMEYSDVQSHFKNYIITGYKDSSLSFHEYDAHGCYTTFSRILTNHTREISCITTCHDFFMTGSSDGTVQLFSYDSQLIAKCSFPEKIYSLGILNNNRDILIGCKYSIMKISYKDKIDPESSPIDDETDNIQQDELESNNRICPSVEKEIDKEGEQDTNTTQREIFTENSNKKSISKDFDNNTTINSSSKKNVEKEQLTQYERAMLLREMMEATMGTRYRIKMLREDIQKNRRYTEFGPQNIGGDLLDDSDEDSIILPSKPQTTKKIRSQGKLKHKRASISGGKDPIFGILGTGYNRPVTSDLNEHLGDTPSQLGALETELSKTNETKVCSETNGTQDLTESISSTDTEGRNYSAQTSLTVSKSADLKSIEEMTFEALLYTQISSDKHKLSSSNEVNVIKPEHSDDVENIGETTPCETSNKDESTDINIDTTQAEDTKLSDDKITTFLQNPIEYQTTDYMKSNEIRNNNVRFKIESLNNNKISQVVQNPNQELSVNTAKQSSNKSVECIKSLRDKAIEKVKAQKLKEIQFDHLSNNNASYDQSKKAPASPLYSRELEMSAPLTPKVENNNTLKQLRSIRTPKVPDRQKPLVKTQRRASNNNITIRKILPNTLKNTTVRRIGNSILADKAPRQSTILLKYEQEA